MQGMGYEVIGRGDTLQEFGIGESKDAASFVLAPILAPDGDGGVQECASPLAHSHSPTFLPALSVLV